MTHFFATLFMNRRLSMIIVQSVGKEQTLARDESEKWYRVSDNSVKVGDIVSLDKCVKLSDLENNVYNSCCELISMAEKSPYIF